MFPSWIVAHFCRKGLYPTQKMFTQGKRNKTSLARIIFKQFKSKLIKAVLFNQRNAVFKFGSSCLFVAVLLGKALNVVL
jgi:hypothetical protein